MHNIVKNSNTFTCNKSGIFLKNHIRIHTHGKFSCKLIDIFDQNS
jgi:hypothetical protein